MPKNDIPDWWISSKWVPPESESDKDEDNEDNEDNGNDNNNNNNNHHNDHDDATITSTVTS